MQTLSEHDTLPWLQGTEADGTIDLPRVGDEAVIIRLQQGKEVPLSLVHQRLHQKEKEPHKHTGKIEERARDRGRERAVVSAVSLS